MYLLDLYNGLGILDTNLPLPYDNISQLISPIKAMDQSSPFKQFPPVYLLKIDVNYNYSMRIFNCPYMIVMEDHFSFSRKINLNGKSVLILIIFK